MQKGCFYGVHYRNVWPYHLTLSIGSPADGRCIITVFIRHRPNCDSNTKIILENGGEALQGLMNK